MMLPKATGGSVGMVLSADSSGGHGPDASVPECAPGRRRGSSAEAEPRMTTGIDCSRFPSPSYRSTRKDQILTDRFS